MRRHIGLGTLLTLTSTCFAVAACQGLDESNTDAASVTVDPQSTLPTSAQTLARVNDIRTRFQVAAPEEKTLRSNVAHTLQAAAVRTRPVIAPTLTTRFVPSPGGLAATHVRAELPASGAKRVATVDLPRSSTGAVMLEDAATHVRVGFALHNAKSSEAKQAGGYTIYPGAANGADVVHRVHAEGTEDFIAFETKPAVTALSYDVDLTNVAGLRLVSNTLEFVDAAGSPSLRVEPPYVVDSVGKRHAAKLGVEGCAVDTNPAAPWGRELTPPGATKCTVTVAWGEVSYPALVDPSWTTTGSMQARWMQSASRLASGRVLVSGGYNTQTWDIRNSAEVYNPATGTFAATGSLVDYLIGHTQTLLSNGNTLVAGGDPWYGMGSAPLNIAQIYNEGSGTFSYTSSMGAGRRFSTGTALSNGKVLVVGGRIFGWGPEAELFDPSSNTFSTVSLPAIGSDEGSHTATLLGNGNVLLTSGTSTAAYQYNPSTNSASATGSQISARNDAGAIRLGSGKVLVFGGYDAWGNQLSSAATYDPNTGSWSATGNMVLTGWLGEAGPLSSGGAIIVGYGNSTQVYNPSTNSFSYGASLNYGRYNPTVTALTDGRLLVAGGDAWGGEPQSTVELYNQ
jgi:hypothetical protein